MCVYVQFLANRCVATKCVWRHVCDCRSTLGEDHMSPVALPENFTYFARLKKKKKNSLSSHKSPCLIAWCVHAKCVKYVCRINIHIYIVYIYKYTLSFGGSPALGGGY